MKTKQTPESVTAQYDFLNTIIDGERLLSVRSGIPLGGGFDQLCIYVSSVQSLIEQLARSDDPDIHGSLWAASHLLEVSYSLIQAMHQGHILNLSKNEETQNNESSTKTATRMRPAETHIKAVPSQVNS